MPDIPVLYLADFKGSCVRVPVLGPFPSAAAGEALSTQRHQVGWLQTQEGGAGIPIWLLLPAQPGWEL